MKIIRFLAPFILLVTTSFGQVSMYQVPGNYTDKGVARRVGTYNKYENTSVLITDTNGILIPGELTLSSLTSGRVPFASTAGLLADSSALTFNSGTGALSATSFVGAFTGTATNATNIGITNDTTTNATMYPLWATANTGNLPAKVTSTKLSFNPSTGILASTGFTGSLAGGTALPVSGINATGTPSSSTFLRGDGTWNTPAGSGTVTVVSSGSLTLTALVTGGGTTTLQTPSATATMDSSGNISTPGTLTTGAGSGGAGTWISSQGTAPSLVATSFALYAPTSVAAGGLAYVFPGTASSGILTATNSAGVMTISHTATNGTGNVLLSAGTAAIASAKTLTVSNSLTLAGTDGTTQTFPTTTATIARTDAAQTFTGVQTMTSPAFTTSFTTASTSFTALAGATTLLTFGGTGASASTFFPSTLDTSSSVTGAIRTSGGISAAKALNIGTTITGGGNLTIGTSNSATVGTIELGAASDTTLSRSAAGVMAVEGVVVPSISSTNTLTNKRITARVLTVASSATPTANTDNADVIYITALAAAVTNMSTNLTGTPAASDQLEYWIVDNATPRTISWGSAFTAGPVALPTTTVTSKPLHVYFERDPGNTTWACQATASDL